jgi:hypothetical protein
MANFPSYSEAQRRHVESGKKVKVPTAMIRPNFQGHLCCTALLLTIDMMKQLHLFEVKRCLSWFRTYDSKCYVL